MYIDDSNTRLIHTHVECLDDFNNSFMRYQFLEDYGDQACAQYALDTKSQYILEATTSVTFRASDKELPKAVKVAQDVLTQRLYGRIQSPLAELRLALLSGDKDRCLQIVDKMQDGFKQ
jgi:hypothetical protein